MSDLKLENGVLKLQSGQEVDATVGVTPEGTKFKATGLPEGLTLTATAPAAPRGPSRSPSR